MRLRDISIRSMRNLKQAKARTILTSLAIGVGAFTITLSLALGAGGRSYTDQIISANTDPQELVVTTQPSRNEQGPQKYSENSNGLFISAPIGSTGLLTEKDFNAIKDVNHVVSVLPNYNPQIKYITRPSQDKYLASISAFSPNVTLEYIAGSVGNVLEDDEIILTEDYVKALGFKDNYDAIGKNVQIVADKLSAPLTSPESKIFLYKVKAVSSASGLAFRAQNSLLVSNKSAKLLYDYVNNGTRGYNNFAVTSVRIDDTQNAQEVKDELEKMGYRAQTSADILGVVNTFINVLQGILLGFGALATLTSIFGIINTQYISVLERTQQIGLMKALGMRRRDVGRLFKIEAAWIGFLGASIGIVLAIISGTIANPFISRALDIGEINLLIFEPLSCLLVLLSLILISVSSGILPSRRAAGLNPIDALRTE